MGEPGSEGFSWDQQVVKKPQEVAKAKAIQRDFLNPFARAKSLLGMVIGKPFQGWITVSRSVFFIWE
jgi:hypothetical protein